MARRALSLGFMAMVSLLPLASQAREQIRVVGSSTVFPFIAAAAEQFGRAGQFHTPVVESTGTGGGIKLFCSGVGDGYPDVANASRPIKESEVALCHTHGIDGVTELKIGYDGIVLANARASKPYALTRRTLFLALAREVPKDGKWVNNFYQRWSEVDPALPNEEIAVYGPPPSSGTRDAFVELVMEGGCSEITDIKTMEPDEKKRKHRCGAIREDGAFVEAGEDDNLIVQKLVSNPAALGIFGYSFLENNLALVKANPIDGVVPSYEAIESGTYHVARSLYVYFKQAHVGKVPGMQEFAREITSDAAAGEDGYMVMKGLLPLTSEEHEAMKQVAAGL